MHYVYYIWNLDEDTLLYIGCSTDPAGRLSDFMRREGVSAVLGHVDAYDSLEEAARAELRAIAEHWPPYNIRLVLYAASNEAREKQSIRKTGTRQSPETRAKISQALLGKPKSSEHVTNNAAAHRGRPSGRKGAPPTMKMLQLWESMKGKPTPMKGKPKGSKNKLPVSAETRQKLSMALKGRPSSLKGKPRPPDVRQKISDSLRRTKSNKDEA